MNVHGIIFNITITYHSTGSTVARTEADDINSDNALDHFHVFHHRQLGSADCQFSVLDDTGNDETVLNCLHALRQTSRKVH